jgi:hypothetical protein
VASGYYHERMSAKRPACCDGYFKARDVSSSDRLVVRQCASCRTLWGFHSTIPDGKPWDDSYLNPQFVKALRDRREKQVEVITGVLTDHHAVSPLLDYGSGQGVFLSRATKAGFDAWGCDIDPDIPLNMEISSKVFHVSEPWELPPGDWQTFVMLDVLEHHPDPGNFLRRLDGRHLFLKVPTATGPAALSARLLARLGRPTQLEQLFLAGENAPHHWLATRRGLRSIAKAGGWERKWRGSIVEVGVELPDRMRPRPAGVLKRSIVAALGAATGAIGSVWSDAELAYFERVG